MCCNRATPGHQARPTSLIRVIRGQASSGNQIRETQPEDRPQNLRAATYQTAGEAHATLEPHADQAPEFLT